MDYFLGKNNGVSCHALQGIFLTQGSNPQHLGLLHWQAGFVLFCFLPLSLSRKPEKMLNHGIIQPHAKLTCREWGARHWKSSSHFHCDQTCLFLCGLFVYFLQWYAGLFLGRSGSCICSLSHGSLHSQYFPGFYLTVAREVEAASLALLLLHPHGVLSACYQTHGKQDLFHIPWLMVLDPTTPTVAL